MRHDINGYQTLKETDQDRGKQNLHWRHPFTNNVYDH